MRVWDMPGFNKKLKIQDHSGSVTSIAFSPDGAFILSAGDDGISIIRRASDFAEAAALADHTGPITDAAFSPDGSHLVSVGRAGTIAAYGFQRA